MGVTKSFSHQIQQQCIVNTLKGPLLIIQITFKTLDLPEMVWIIKWLTIITIQRIAVREVRPGRKFPHLKTCKQVIIQEFTIKETQVWVQEVTTRIIYQDTKEVYL